jgi:hypothetical protein
MSRSALSLYELDRPKLQALSAELEQLLYDDDRAALATLLELGDELAARLKCAPRAVDLFVVAEGHELAGPLLASLRRVSKKRALSKVMTSTSLSLEGRLRGFEPLRDERPLAALVDKLLSPKRLPWYLRRAGATCGWLDARDTADLARGMSAMGTTLTPELVELAESLESLSGDAVLHDML